MGILRLSLLLVFLFGPIAGTAKQKALTCDELFPHPDTISKKPAPLPDLSRRPDGHLIENRSITSMVAGKPRVIKFAHHKASIQPSKGTVIFFQGGPGIVSHGHRHPSIPPDYNVVTFDYFGLGQNRKHNTPELMRIEAQAEVGTRIALSLNEPNLFLYGTSFGTTVATATGYQLSHLSGEHKTQAKGILLEGVVGPKHQRNLQLKSFKANAEEAWRQLTKDEKRRFKREYKRSIDELSVEQRLKLDGHLTRLLGGGVDHAVQKLKSFSEQDVSGILYPQMASDSPGLTLEQYKQQMEYFRVQEADTTNMYRAAGCQLTPEKNKTPKIFRPKFVFDGTVTLWNHQTEWTETQCLCRTVNSSFHPGQYPVKDVPMIYINGVDDPYTKVEGANTHFKSQNRADEKALIRTATGGHFPTSQDKYLHCMPFFFESLKLGKLDKINGNLEAIQKHGCTPGGAPEGVSAPTTNSLQGESR